MIHIHKKKYEYFEEINEGILKFIPFNNTQDTISVLDVGCGSGALSEAIKKKGYVVWGIEENEDAAKKTAQRINKIIHADLTNYEFIKKEIDNNLFDYLIFSDVLEHLYDPFSIVQEYLKLLKMGGYILISVPNGVVWTNRLSFLFGRFEYSDTGVMDRTHIRYFTFKTAIRLLVTAGCSIVKTDYTPYFIRAALPIIKKMYKKGQSKGAVERSLIIDSPLYSLYMQYVYPLEYICGYLFKPLFAFRIIIMGRKEA